MKQTLLSIAILALLIIPGSTEAATPEEEFLHQLKAVVGYLERMVTVDYEPLSQSEMRDVILDGTDWMVSVKQDDGGFGYEYLPYEGMYSGENAMVRQSGTFFALAEVYRAQSEKDPAVAEALEGSIRYFRDHTQESIPSDGDFVCIYNAEFDTECRLGASALTLLGLLSYAEADPEAAAEHEDLIEAYKDYLLAAKFDGAGFSNRYQPSTSFASEESPFFNGEAMLALAKYYDYSKDEDIAVVFADTFKYLKDAPKESPLYLWMMAALKEAKVHWDNPEHIAYAEAFTDEQIARSRRNRATEHNYCAPAEGLTSAYAVLEGEVAAGKLASLKTEIDHWLSKTTNLQLSSEQPYRFTITDGEAMFMKQVDPEIAHGGFLTGEDTPYQRIDFTQHCVSAYLQAYEDINGWQL